MATDETKKSDPPESGPDSGEEEEEVHTAVETVDAKKKASSEPPAKAADESDDDESDEDDDESDENDDESDESDDESDESDDESDEDDDESDENDDEVAEKAPKPAPKAAKPAPKEHAHEGDAGSHGHGLAHVTPVPLLFAVLGGLLFLTFATVEVTSFDMGGQWNLVAAMVIATMKASLVVTFFMHLAWDKKFNLVLFLTSVLFLILFLGMTLTDRKEYQHFIDQKAETAAQTTAQ